MKTTVFVFTSFLLLSLSAFSQYNRGDGSGSISNTSYACQGNSKVTSVNNPKEDNTVLSRTMQSSLETYPSQNISLLAHWDSTRGHTIRWITSEGKDTSVFINTSSYSNVWGWANPKDKKEYAIVGSSDGTYFIDVTVPTTPVVCDLDTAYNDVIEIKTYLNYAYLMNTMGGGGKWTLRIVDLKYLPDSVHLVYDDADTVVPSSHTIFIDGDKLYCAMTYRQFLYQGNYQYQYSPMEVFSLANPEAPKLLRKLQDDDTLLNRQLVHDMFVRNDTVYASVPSLGILIYKFSSNKFLRIGELTKYDEQGYNHSSALTADGKTLIFCDEIPAGLSAKFLDVSDFNNLTVRNYFKDTITSLAIPHNPYIRKDDNTRVVIAYYRDGVQIFDITNPSDVIRTGYFDTSPVDTFTNTMALKGFAGCFGAYIDLPSGIILACDMQNGLFILDATKAMTNTTGIGTPSSNDIANNINVFPNPANENFIIETNTNTNGKQELQVFDVTGRLVLSQIINGKATIDARYLSKGIYNLQLTRREGVVNKKLIKY